jgi:Uma2 family endonuclease
MTTLLEIPEVRQRVSKLTIEQYHLLDEFNESGRRTELLRGFIIDKMPKSPLHSAVVKRLYDHLSRQVGSGLVVRREDPLTFKDSEPEPDISVVRGREEDFFKMHPTSAELVIEVAVSSAALDRANANLYAEAGVKEYWIMLPELRQVEIYRFPESGKYREITTLNCEETPELISTQGLKFPMREIFLQ